MQLARKQLHLAKAQLAEVRRTAHPHPEGAPGFCDDINRNLMAPVPSKPVTVSATDDWAVSLTQHSGIAPTSNVLCCWCSYVHGQKVIGISWCLKAIEVSDNLQPRLKRPLQHRHLVRQLFDPCYTAIGVSAPRSLPFACIRPWI